MVRMLPNIPVPSSSPEVLRVHRLLRQLRDDQFVIWQRLPIWPGPAPDFVVLSSENRAIVIKVSSTTRQQVLRARQPDFFEDSLEAKATLVRLFQDGQEALFQFRAQLHRCVRDMDIDVGQSVPLVLAFPNVRSRDLRPVVREQIRDGIAWVAKDHLTPGDFEDWLRGRLGPPLPTGPAESLRKTFTPEAVIPAEFTVRQTVHRNTDARSADYLFDYDQEWAMKVDLQPPEDVDLADGTSRLRLINGVAGSGKSLLIVYRAHLLQQLSSESNLLVVTHNKPLTHDLAHRYQRLEGSHEPVPWITTFMGWCRKNWPEGWVSPIGMAQREEIARLAWHRYLADTPMSEQELLGEIDWFKDRLLTSREDYLEADRRGRGFGADERRRNLMFDAMLAYNRELRRLGKLDWGDVPRRMWLFMEAGRVEVGRYDAILVDEAQFFAPIWFEIIKRLLKPGTGQLFMVADSTQGFLKRGQSWLASGLDVRGKSLRLNRSYRTTREILSFASLLYRTRLPDDEEDIVVPDLLDMPNGIIPQVVQLTAQQDEITRVVNEIKRLVDLNVPLEHILVIHANWRGTVQLIERLTRLLGPGTAVDAKTRAPGKHIRVSTLNASAGLESPVVLLAGIHELHEREQSLRISDDERQELVRDNTRKLFMAITRAGQRLLITYVGELPPVLETLFKSAPTVGEPPDLGPG